MYCITLMLLHKQQKKYKKLTRMEGFDMGFNESIFRERLITDRTHIVLLVLKMEQFAKCIKIS